MAAKLNIQMTKEQRNALIAAVAFFGVGGFMYFKYFWNPVSLRIDDARGKIEDANQKIEKAKSQAARLPRIQHELEALNQQAADVEQRLPKDKDVPKVLETISTLADRYGVVINNFAPGASSAKQYFLEVPYTMNIVGTYNEIGRFFAAIALEERIFNLRNVTYGAGGAATGGEQPLAVTFTLVSYQYKG